MTDTPTDRESVDPLHVKGPDGITRRVDEHYFVLSDVQQDPPGAWLAIQNLCAALDEAEAALERVRAEEREACFSAAEYVSDGRIAALQADSAEADDPYGDGLLDEAVSLSAEMLAAIRARGET